jgi:hypothetical protein
VEHKAALGRSARAAAGSTRRSTRRSTHKAAEGRSRPLGVVGGGRPLHPVAQGRTRPQHTRGGAAGCSGHSTHGCSAHMAALCKLAHASSDSCVCARLRAFVDVQTGAGKTHTMMGGGGDQEGVIPRSIRQVTRRALSVRRAA